MPNEGVAASMSVRLLGGIVVDMDVSIENFEDCVALAGGVGVGSRLLIVSDCNLYGCRVVDMSVIVLLLGFD